MNGIISPKRLFAVAISLAATAFFMVLFRVAHAPAGATTLLISLGLITRPFHMLVIEIAVVLLCLQAIYINRLAGLNYPFWSGRVDSAMETITIAPSNKISVQENRQNSKSQDLIIGSRLLAA